VSSDIGIVHEVNLEYRACRLPNAQAGPARAYQDALLGTDSHTMMVNGFGVPAWGVGEIDAEATMARPADVDADPAGCSAFACAEGTTVTDLVLDGHRDAALAQA
jgi:aconitate hydratase